jgi:hypothetical protein
MNRLTGAALFGSSLLAASAGFLGSSCNEPGLPYCNIPTLDEKGADGGPDPCHCDPPPSLNISACLCLSGTQGDVDLYNACMATYWVEVMDAGVD